MKLNFLTVKLSCKDCGEIYYPKSLPLDLPSCPLCQSKEFDLHDDDLDYFMDDTPLMHNLDDLKLVEEYKNRIAFLLLQLKVLNKNEPYQF